MTTSYKKIYSRTGFANAGIVLGSSAAAVCACRGGGESSVINVATFVFIPFTNDILKYGLIPLILADRM